MLAQIAETKPDVPDNNCEETQLALLAAMILVKRRRTGCYPIPAQLIDLVDQLIEVATSDSSKPDESDGCRKAKQSQILVLQQMRTK